VLTSSFGSGTSSYESGSTTLQLLYYQATWCPPDREGLSAQSQAGTEGKGGGGVRREARGSNRGVVHHRYYHLEDVNPENLQQCGVILAT
jgi:hypothetical protein